MSDSAMKTHPNYAILDGFYDAFSRKDHETMRTYYAPEATFEDPAFKLDSGARAADMWEMLCKRGADLGLDYEVLSVDDDGGQVKWDAHYTFSQTGNKVHNIIVATIKLRDGKIVEHRDDFDFWRWSSQALGLPGKVLGWSGFLRDKVRQKAGKQLELYVAKRDAAS